MKKALIVVCSLFMVMMGLCCSSQPASQKQMLFNGQDFTGWTFYLEDETVQPMDVWSVKEGVVQCKGVPTGYMRTEKTYSNYKLHVEWRWTAEPTNSGVLIHTRLPDRIWPNSFECQLMAGSAGDFVLIGPNAVTVGDSTYRIEQDYRIIAKAHESSEKTAGEWNVYDIIAKGNTVRAEVNGVVQNLGTEMMLTSGHISLQSEGSPIEFKNVWIEQL
jgi:hypothetical protein